MGEGPFVVYSRAPVLHILISCALSSCTTLLDVHLCRNEHVHLYRNFTHTDYTLCGSVPIRVVLLRSTRPVLSGT